MTATGGVLVAFGSLDALGVLGGNCQERARDDGSLSTVSCGSHGARDAADGTTIGIGVGVAAAGALLWALSGSDAPEPAPACVGACGAAREPAIPDAQITRGAHEAPVRCASADACGPSLDPRRVIDAP